MKQTSKLTSNRPHSSSQSTAKKPFVLSEKFSLQPAEGDGNCGPQSLSILKISFGSRSSSKPEKMKSGFWTNTSKLQLGPKAGVYESTQALAIQQRTPISLLCRANRKTDRPSSQPASHPASQPVSHQVSHPASHQVNKPPSRVEDYSSSLKKIIE